MGGISASGTIGGTIEEPGIQASSTYSGYGRKLGSGGWELTSGKQLSNWHTGTDWSYSGSRSQSLQADCAAISG